MFLSMFLNAGKIDFSKQFSDSLQPLPKNCSVLRAKIPAVFEKGFI